MKIAEKGANHEDVDNDSVSPKITKIDPSLLQINSPRGKANGQLGAFQLGALYGGKRPNANKIVLQQRIPNSCLVANSQCNLKYFMVVACMRPFIVLTHAGYAHISLDGGGGGSLKEASRDSSAYSDVFEQVDEDEEYQEQAEVEPSDPKDAKAADLRGLNSEP